MMPVRPTLGVIPAVGSGLDTMAQTGQLARLIRHLEGYVTAFHPVYFSWLSWEPEVRHWPWWSPDRAVSLMCPLRPSLGPLTAFLRPLREWRYWRPLSLVRAMNLLGAIPAISARMVYGTPFVVSFGADYQTIATIHGHGAWHLRKWRWLEGAACALASAVLVSNRNYLERLRLRHPKARLVFHPNWTDLAMFRPADLSEKRIHFSGKKDSWRVLFVGRLVHEKNVERLAEAVRGLTIGGRRVELHCVGTGPLSEAVQAAGGIMHGAVAWDALPAVYQAADVFALPSLSEGHPKALTEAMACRLPVVTSLSVCRDLGFPPGVVACDPLDVGSIRSALDTAFSHAHTLGTAARAHAEAHWGLDRLMAREVALLTTAMRSRGYRRHHP